MQSGPLMRVGRAAREKGSGKFLVGVALLLAVCLAAGCGTPPAVGYRGSGTHVTPSSRQREHFNKKSQAHGSANSSAAWRYSPIRGVSFKGAYAYPGFNSISCPTPSVCWLAGSRSVRTRATAYGMPILPLLLVTRNGGMSWASERLPSAVGRLAKGRNLADDALYSITCPDALHCWAVGATRVLEVPSNPKRVPSYRPPKPFILATHNGGKTWNLQAVPKNVWSTAEGLGTSGMVNVSPANAFGIGWSGLGCSTDLTCWVELLIVGNSPPHLHHEYYELRTDNGGATWSVVQRMPETVRTFVGRTQTSQGYITYNSSSKDPWRATGVDEINGLSCPTQSTCWGIASLAGYFEHSPPPGSASHFLQSHARLGKAISSLLPVIGPSGSKHVVVLSTNGGLTWSLPGLAGLPVGNWDVTSLSCPNATDCFAGASFALPPASSTSEPSECDLVCAATIATTNGGATWTVQNYYNWPKVKGKWAASLKVLDIYCASSSSCTEFVLSGPLSFSGPSYPIASYVTVDGGRTWTREAVDQRIGQGQLLSRSSGLSSLVCPDPRDCWAIGTGRIGDSNSFLFHVSS